MKKKYYLVVGIVLILIIAIALVLFYLPIIYFGSNHGYCLSTEQCRMFLATSTFGVGCFQCFEWQCYNNCNSRTLPTK